MQAIQAIGIDKKIQAPKNKTQFCIYYLVSVIFLCNFLATLLSQHSTDSFFFCIALLFLLLVRIIINVSIEDARCLCKHYAAN